jgi:hypothetical protein
MLYKPDRVAVHLFIVFYEEPSLRRQFANKTCVYLPRHTSCRGL